MALRPRRPPQAERGQDLRAPGAASAQSDRPAQRSQRAPPRSRTPAQGAATRTGPDGEVDAWYKQVQPFFPSNLLFLKPEQPCIEKCGKGALQKRICITHVVCKKYVLFFLTLRDFLLL